MNAKATAKEQVKQVRGRHVQGLVVRRSGEKTISVQVERVMRHPKYGKKVVMTKKYLVHDPKNEGEVGQTVTIREYRPTSARKRWLLVGNSST